MSIWYEIKDKEDICLSDDDKSLQINFDGNDDGNIWVEVPLELIDQLRQPDVSGRSELLLAFGNFITSDTANLNYSPNEWVKMFLASNSH